MISHNLHDLFEVADRFLVLRLGQSVGEYDRATTTQQEIVEALTAGRLSLVPGQEVNGTETDLAKAATQ